MPRLPRTVTSVETFAGHFLDFLEPTPNDIELNDIARGLAMTVRFTGQVTRRYCVAEHTVYVRSLVIERGYPELGLPALHHDSHEAYLGDWTSPLKLVIEQRAPGLFDELSSALDRVVAAKFGFDYELLSHPVIKEADEYALRREAATLKWSHGAGPHWGTTEPARPLAGIGWGEDRAEREFLRAHEEEMTARPVAKRFHCAIESANRPGTTRCRSQCVSCGLMTTAGKVRPDA